MTADIWLNKCCEVMHDAYEKAAVGAGWETNPASRKPWSDVPAANQATMRAAVQALLDGLAADLEIASRIVMRDAVTLGDSVLVKGIALGYSGAAGVVRGELDHDAAEPSCPRCPHSLDWHASGVCLEGLPRRSCPCGRMHLQ